MKIGEEESRRGESRSEDRRRGESRGKVKREKKRKEKNIGLSSENKWNGKMKSNNILPLYFLLLAILFF